MMKCQTNPASSPVSRVTYQIRRPVATATISCKCRLNFPIIFNPLSSSEEGGAQPNPNPKCWPAFGYTPTIKAREGKNGRQPGQDQSPQLGKQLGTVTDCLHTHLSPPTKRPTDRGLQTFHTPGNTRAPGATRKTGLNKGKMESCLPLLAGRLSPVLWNREGPSVASRRWLEVRRRGQAAAQALALSSCRTGTCCQTGSPSPLQGLPLQP